METKDDMFDQKIKKLTTATLVDFKVCEINPKTLSESYKILFM